MVSVTTRKTGSGQLVTYEEGPVKLAVNRDGVHIYEQELTKRQHIGILSRLLARAWMTHTRIQHMAPEASLPLEEC